MASSDAEVSTMFSHSLRTIVLTANESGGKSKRIDLEKRLHHRRSKSIDARVASRLVTQRLGDLSRADELCLGRP